VTKKDKQIPFTELSFQLFLEKFVTIVQYCIQNQFPGMSDSAFCLRGIFNPWPDL